METTRSRHPSSRGCSTAGGFGQLASQLIGALTVFAYAVGLGYVLFKVIERTIGLRAEPGDELKGLDLVEHGAQAYPEEEGGL